MGPGGRSAARVQRVQRVRPAFGRLVQRVADCRSAAMLIKSALRDLLSVSYGMISILLIGSLRSPPPIRLRRTSPRESVSHDSQVASLPYESCSLATPSGGQNKTPRNILFISSSTVSTGCCAPACGGKVVALATKGGISLARQGSWPVFRRPQGGCKVFL